MKISYWEYKTWLQGIDFGIIGSGIVGLSAALSIKKDNPSAKVVVFESGILPSGASTKNAGFACFGSISEVLDDLNTHSEDEVISLLQKRYHGLQWLKHTLGEENIDYKPWGGYEVFSEKDTHLYEYCLENLEYINNLTKEAISSQNDVFLIKKDTFSFKNTKKQLIFNQFEGQIDTGEMMKVLLQKCTEKGVLVLNSIKIESILDKNDQVLLKNDIFNPLFVKQLLVATNGFSKQFFKELDITPARAQVLITEPIPNLPIKGTFHLDKGFYYFRNIDNRILFGGGRNLDFITENTSEAGLTDRIQSELERLLTTTILPNTPFKIAQRWSGIMGVGAQKSPIVKRVSKNVVCAIRLGGMGVAIGGLVGKEASELIRRC